jgi:hypothetical protein
MSEHYQKYKETIKKVSQRNYRKRKIWVNEHLSDKFCKYCGESETACLQFYPHDKEIRKLTKRKGLNEESRVEVNTLIKQSQIVCANCFLKIENDILDINM